MLSYAGIYVCICFVLVFSTCFLVGPRKSYLSLIHANRKLVAFLYLSLLLLLAWVGLMTRLEWLGVLPIWFIHLAAFSWYCLMNMPLSRAVLQRAIALAYKTNTQHTGTTNDQICCGTAHSRDMVDEQHVTIDINE